MSDKIRPPAPVDVQADRARRQLHIRWNDGSDSNYPFVYLREECRCAACVDERTGVRILDPATIPADLSIETMELVGNYALRLRYTDGHDTGLYSWTRLRELAQPAP